MRGDRERAGARACEVVRAVEEHDLPGDVDAWKELRDRLRREIDERGVGPDGAFRQTYDNDHVDASLLQIPQTGFCAYDDPRMLATVARIEKELVDDAGMVHRYRTTTGVDGLAGDEHPFMACTFWMVTQYALSGRRDDAEKLMARACATANDLGLFSEEYDVGEGRQAGNTPQALSHLAFVRAADALAST